MSRHYYLCPVVEIEDPDFGPMMIALVATISVPLGTSRTYLQEPTNAWALTVDSHPTETLPVITDEGVYAFPDASLDALVSSFSTQEMTDLAQALEDRGIASAFLSSVVEFREIIRHIGLSADSNFNENYFGIDASR